MRAVCFEGKERVRVETVPDPVILNPRDAIVKVTTTAICGSDLHIYDGYIPTMQKGDVLGHEFMGEVVDVGKDNTRLKVGDRVVVPFTIACGRCYFCKEQLWSLCDNSNPNAWMAEKLHGYSASGLFGYSHMYGGYLATGMPPMMDATYRSRSTPWMLRSSRDSICDVSRSPRTDTL
jgi:threonine dehydrogenase-like Zn-dependent dehydrogenase